MSFYRFEVIFLLGYNFRLLSALETEDKQRT